MRPIRSSALCAMTFAVTAATMGAGCAKDPIHQIDMQVDCENICNRYRDCYDASYNTSGCQDRCHAMVNHDPNSANACDSCLDAHTCTTTPFSCGVQCQGILP